MGYMSTVYPSTSKPKKHLKVVVICATILLLGLTTASVIIYSISVGKARKESMLERIENRREGEEVKSVLVQQTNSEEIVSKIASSTNDKNSASEKKRRDHIFGIPTNKMGFFFRNSMLILIGTVTTVCLFGELVYMMQIKHFNDPHFSLSFATVSFSYLFSLIGVRSLVASTAKGLEGDE